MNVTPHFIITFLNFIDLWSSLKLVQIVEMFPYSLIRSTIKYKELLRIIRIRLTYQVQILNMDISREYQILRTS